MQFQHCRAGRKTACRRFVWEEPVVREEPVVTGIDYCNGIRIR